MMLYPEIAKLMEGMPSRYSLVIVTAKRARQLAEKRAAEYEAKKAIDKDCVKDLSSDRHVSVAIGEISEGKVKIKA